MAWGDKGTLFVGTFDNGTVHAIIDQGGKKVVKTYHQRPAHADGHRLPRRRSLRDRHRQALQVRQRRSQSRQAPEGKVVYDDLPPYVPHGWKYLVPTARRLVLHSRSARLQRLPAADQRCADIAASIRRTARPRLVALGVRNSVGGDVDPRTGDLWFSENARDWMSDDMPSDKLNHVTKFGEHFGYPYCHQGDMPDPKFGMGHKCSEFTPPVLKLGPHVAPLGMKFYTGNSSRPSTRTTSSSPSTAPGTGTRSGRRAIMRFIADPDGKNAKEEVFASGLAQRDADCYRPSRRHPHRQDGSLLVADDWAGAIYQISYKKP